jgi:hypothetical protein
MGSSGSSGVRKSPQFGLWLAVVMAGSMWFYVQHVLIPYQMTDAALHGRPRGILSDLYPRWVGTRELLFEHRDPYSAEVTREIQMGYYGRLLDPKRPNDPIDEQRFAYPVFVVFLLAPAALIPFAVVKTIAEWGFAVLTMVSIQWWLRALRWQPPRAVIAIFMIVTIGNFGTVFGLKLQQLSLLVSGLIAASAALLAAGQLFLAGLVLAAATIKPQLVVPLAAWLILWALSDWKKRKRFFWGFMITEALLVGAGECILPGWIGRFADAVVAYRRYTGGGSPLDSLVTRTAGPLLGVVLAVITAALCWQLRRVTSYSRGFHLMLAFVLAVTTVIVPMVAPYNHLLLLPAVLLIVQAWNDLWSMNTASRVVCSLTLIAVLWPWAASLGLSMASLVLPPALVQRAWTVPLWTSLAIPITVLALLAFCLNANLKATASRQQG